MFERLRRMFDDGDPLVALARSGDGSLFRETFRSSEVFVVSKATDATLDPATATAAELEALMREADRQRAGERPFEAFVYGPEGREILPVFSCREAAETFVRRYARAANRVVPLVVASLEGFQLLPFLGGAPRLTLNPLNHDELELPRELVAELVR